MRDSRATGSGIARAFGVMLLLGSAIGACGSGASDTPPVSPSSPAGSASLQAAIAMSSIAALRVFQPVDVKACPATPKGEEIDRLREFVVPRAAFERGRRARRFAGPGRRRSTS